MMNHDSKTSEPNATPDSKDRMDKTIFDVRHLHDRSNDLAYWLTKTPEERIAGVEMMRQHAYGYTSENQPKLQRVFEVVKFTSYKAKR